MLAVNNPAEVGSPDSAPATSTNDQPFWAYLDLDIRMTHFSETAEI